MSRSLVGSSSSSTLGSPSSSRSSWSRRRSPPERSPIRAVSRSPVKPNRSSIAVAVTSRPPTDATRRIDSTESSTRCAGSRLSSACVRCASATVRPVRSRPASGGDSPASTESTDVLPDPLTPISTDPVPRSEPPGDVVDQVPSPARDRRVLEVEHVLAEPGGGEPLQLDPVARRRLVLDQLRSRVDAGTSAWTCAPEDPDAARRAPCASGSAAVSPWPPPGGRARPWRARTPHSRPRSGRPSASCTSHVVVHTASRNQRSCVTTTRALPRAEQVTCEPVDALDVEVVGGLVEKQDVELPEQRGSQRDPSPLASGQARDRSLEIESGEQVHDDLARSAVSRPLVLGALADDEGPDRRGLVEVVVLADHRPAESSVVGDAARVRRLHAGEQPQQRGLAVAVATDDADPVPGLRHRGSRRRATAGRRRPWRCARR